MCLAFHTTIERRVEACFVIATRSFRFARKEGIQGRIDSSMPEKRGESGKFLGGM
jgi:hypothetical protein